MKNKIINILIVIIIIAIVILGYFIFEGVLYGFGPSAVNIPANGVQGIAGLILGCILIKRLEKSKFIRLY